mmetsp:Transcript_24492/g.45815  ORF Transcript_24492/g.45815 Transcript_24492/m.45815 type:complete len:81 (+) Transcript_24492:268-510(+)
MSMSGDVLNNHLDSEYITFYMNSMTPNSSLYQKLLKWKVFVQLTLTKFTSGASFLRVYYFLTELLAKLDVNVIVIPIVFP